MTKSSDHRMPAPVVYTVAVYRVAVLYRQDGSRYLGGPLKTTEGPFFTPEGAQCRARELRAEAHKVAQFADNYVSVHTGGIDTVPETIKLR